MVVNNEIRYKITIAFLKLTLNASCLKLMSGSELYILLGVDYELWSDVVCDNSNLMEIWHFSYMWRMTLVVLHMQQTVSVHLYTNILALIDY